MTELKKYKFKPQRGAGKFKPAPRCEGCSKLFKKPKAHRYNICNRCRERLKLVAKTAWEKAS